MRHHLTAYNEILGAMLSACDNDTQALINDPKTYIKTKTGITINDAINLKVTTNENDTVCLALPYYSNLVDVRPLMLSDAQVMQAVGACGSYNIYEDAYAASWVNTFDEIRSRSAVETAVNNPQSDDGK